MQEEPRREQNEEREEGSRLRRVPVRGSADNAEESRTVENPKNESPAGGNHPGGDWQTGGSAGYSEGRYPEDRMSGTPMGAQDEQTWSVLAHLSVLAGLVGLMPFGALIIWLVYKDRSPRVGFHALQSLWYQIAWIVILIVGWFLTFILSFILIGFLLVPVMALASLVPFIHGCYAAYKVSQGVDYRYPFVADRIGGDARRTL
jgi:uncharacterized Tic20 family protein